MYGNRAQDGAITATHIKYSYNGYTAIIMLA